MAKKQADIVAEVQAMRVQLEERTEQMQYVLKSIHDLVI